MQNNKKSILENREFILLEAIERIRQRALDMLYGTEKSPSEIIREAVDEELLDIEARQGRSRKA